MDKRMNFWLGLSDMKREGDWRLASNGLKPSYLNWHKDQPSNETDQDCALLKTGDRYLGRWADTDCENKTWNGGNTSVHALCEYDSTTKGEFTKWQYSTYAIHELNKF